MRHLFILILCFIARPASAQDNENFLQVDANAALNFTITEPSELETDQVLPGAVTIKVASRDGRCNISARMSSFNYPPGFTPPASVLALDWVSDNSNKDYNMITGPVPLTGLDQLLFQQKKTPGNVTYFSYFYNLVLFAPGYTYVPGNYTFTITFTMTQD